MHKADHGVSATLIGRWPAMAPSTNRAQKGFCWRSHWKCCLEARGPTVNPAQPFAARSAGDLVQSHLAASAVDQ